MTTELSAVEPAVRQRHRPTSSAQMEVVASRSVAFFGLLFGAQTLPVMLGQAPLLSQAWFWGYTVAIFGGLLVAVAAAVARRFVRIINIYFASVYLIALALWPFAVIDPSAVEGQRPWLWFLCTVATATAAIALSTLAASVYLVLAPSLYCLIRVTASGGGSAWDLAVLDTVYAILLGGAVLLIITLLRDAAASLDVAQTAALGRYSNAVRQHAIEVERVQVDSIVHDSVLSTLRSAAGAATPDAMKLAATMASEAIGHLGRAGEFPVDDEAVGLDDLVAGLKAAAIASSRNIKVRGVEGAGGSLPAPVAEALHAAAVQAMVNSIQHAGGDEVSRWLTISSEGSGGVLIQVGDTGVGFRVDLVSSERLGVRVSIVERVASVGGRVEVASAPGEGTVIDIIWPDSGSELAPPVGSRAKDTFSSRLKVSAKP